MEELEPDDIAYNPHTTHSVAREKVLEHLFVGELLKHFWRAGRHDLEVLRAEVDRGGYDIVLETRGIARHIQLKTMVKGGKRRDFNISTALQEKPAGCVIIVQFDPDTVTLGPFLWLGGAPAEKLPALGDRMVRHTKGDASGRKAARPGLREVPIRRFETVSSIPDLALRLFGPDQ